MQTPRYSQADASLLPRALLQRAAMPFFLFTLALTGMPGLSRVVLLPQLTSVEIGGTVYDAEALRVYAAALEAEVAAADSERDGLVLPMQQSRYRSFLDAKLTMPSVLALYETVRATARASVPDQPLAVRIDRVRYGAEDRVLTLSGDVRDVGPRSMTVLAQFMEELRALPFVSAIRASRFERLEDPVLGFHSPFTITITLTDPTVSAL